MDANVNGISYGNSGGLVNNLLCELPDYVIGNRLVLAVAAYINTPPAAPAGWQVLFQKWQSTCCLCAFVRDADGSEGETVEVVISAAQQVGAAYAAYSIADFDPNVSPAVATPVGANTSAPNPPAISPPWGSDSGLIIPIIGYRPGTVEVTGFPSGYTDNQVSDRYAASASAGVAMVSKLVNGGDNPGPFTLPNPAAAVAGTIAIKSAV